MTFYQDCSNPHDKSKNMAARERGLFSLHICIENFKILLIRNHLTISILLGRNVALVTLYQDCSSNHDSSKTWLLEGGAYYAPNFKEVGGAYCFLVVCLSVRLSFRPFFHPSVLPSVHSSRFLMHSITLKP